MFSRPMLAMCHRLQTLIARSQRSSVHLSCDRTRYSVGPDAPSPGVRSLLVRFYRLKFAIGRVRSRLTGLTQRPVTSSKHPESVFHDRTRPVMPDRTHLASGQHTNQTPERHIISTGRARVASGWFYQPASYVTQRASRELPERPGVSGHT